MLLARVHTLDGIGAQRDQGRAHTRHKAMWRGPGARLVRKHDCARPALLRRREGVSGIRTAYTVAHVTKDGRGGAVASHGLPQIKAAGSSGLD
eukprot:scaffold128712_cov24-Tisochrysis_lutea.AAC.2